MINSFTLGTIIGWLLGNVPSLLVTPSADVDKATKALREHMEEYVADGPTVRILRAELLKKLFSMRMIAVSLFNGLVLVLILLSITIGPDVLFGRIIPEASSWKLATLDKWILGMVLVLHSFLFYDKGISLWASGLTRLVKASQWLKKQQSRPKQS